MTRPPATNCDTPAETPALEAATSAAPARFQVRLAETEADLRAAQRLRYRVFVEELGGDGPMVDHAARLERDAFDPVTDHLLLIDTEGSDEDDSRVVGAYRLLRSDQATAYGRFYSDGEYDLAPLRATGVPLLELGRSCVDAAHRTGAGIFLLWNGLADYVLANGIEILFGVASFHGTDPRTIELPLSWLYHHHLAPEPLRVHSRKPQRMDLLPADTLNRRAALSSLPGLIKGYLRLGGVVGDTAYVDHEFNTTDVFFVVDTRTMSDRHRDFFTRKSVARDAPTDGIAGADEDAGA